VRRNLMAQLKRIIVGHDLAAGGEAALKSAMVLAGRFDAALRLVHVAEAQHFYQKISHPTQSKDSLENIVQIAGTKLQNIVASRELGSLRADHVVRVGKPSIEIILAASVWQAELIIVGPSRHEGHLLGSTGDRVMRQALVPVLVSKKSLEANAKRFLVPTDFSAGAGKAAKEALALARSFGGRIFFLHVLDLTPLFYACGYEGDSLMSPPIPLPTPEDIAAEWDSFLSTLPLCNIGWEKRTEEGPVVKTILEYAEAIDADLIVMGAHGRNALEHVLLGSVTKAVVRTASCPVLTVRPEAFEFKLP
jgi:nucleotide-binding universal stress UspA family protein